MKKLYKYAYIDIILDTNHCGKKAKSCYENFNNKKASLC